MNKENFFINQFPKNSFNGDDGAVVGEWVYSQDGFFENVHFKREWMSYEQIGYKAMMVNISDAIVMNATPRYALMTAALPDDITPLEMKSLAKGINKAAKKYGITIIGGDTIANSKLDLSITIISHTFSPIYRKGLKKGDIILHTGVLGKVKRDLDILLQGGKVSSKSRFIRPVLRENFFYQAASYISAALDISDGLFFELERLSGANKCGFVLDYPLKEGVGCSGEEYEILFGCDPSHLEMIEKIAKETNTPLAIVGKVTKGAFVSPCKSHHFDQ